ncbi:hypothetical protein QTH27_02185 [Clostridium perfringens]|uniref:hypothetical protein n=1 Tax=Clostridium perfringens TaxID=1502 RepID=UPI002975782A|nr:hypothetical protein [Clostridium perfringens]MDM0475367.1 hypothetical protein [Clostridium perfringens]MDM0476587.1 hypothetical protein [Clostridium perfringens]MDM0480104.1 hypothetical protein [Clostridium perfringens]MDM0485272.1 hypothetical protein [Clostridium perfringens]
MCDILGNVYTQELNIHIYKKEVEEGIKYELNDNHSFNFKQNIIKKEKVKYNKRKNIYDYIDKNRKRFYGTL